MTFTERVAELARRWQKGRGWVATYLRRRDRLACAYCTHFHGIGMKPGAHIFRGEIHL